MFGSLTIKRQQAAKRSTGRALGSVKPRTKAVKRSEHASREFVEALQRLGASEDVIDAAEGRRRH